MVYKIGDFSNITGISISTLRYYDEIGLLKPEMVDQFTNYRFYTEDNVNEASSITLFKKLGFTLDEIMEYKNSSYDNDMANNLLLRKQNQISEEMERLQEMYDNITVLRKNFTGMVLSLKKDEK